MIHSIQTKILFLTAFIFVAATASIIYFTQKDVKDGFLERERKNIENIKNIIHINLEGTYKNLLLDKISFVRIMKKQLKTENGIIMDAIGILCEQSENELDAQQKVIKFLKGLDTSSSIFLTDAAHTIFFHSKGVLNGQNIDEIKDLKSKPVSKSINGKNPRWDKYTVFSYEFAVDEKGLPLQSSLDHILEAGDTGPMEDSFSFGQVEERQLVYLTRFEKWGWVLGNTNDISTFEAEGDAKIDEVLGVLKENFRQISIAETGTIFLFNGRGEVLIPPFQNYGAEISREFTNTLADSVSGDNTLKLFMGETEIDAYTSHVRALDWYITALVPAEEIKQSANHLAAHLSKIIGAIFLIGFIVLATAVRRVSGPLQQLALKLKDIPGKDLTDPQFIINLKAEFLTKRKDEVGDLAGSFIYMFQELQKNIRELIATNAAKERIEGELNVARDIQLGILPKIFPPYPHKEQFDLHAYLKPAREVGGDLYDFFLVDDDHLCISIGDVSGKGVPAALFMVITKTLIKTYSETTMSASEIVTKINDVLSRENPNCMFVTLIVGILNIRTGELKYANAGHNPPLIKSVGTSFYQKGLSGPLAGAMEGIGYKELSLTLKKGDSLFFYTDGVTEAMNCNKEVFSDARLEAVMNSASCIHAKDIIECVNKEIKSFVGDEPQYDDITMLSLSFRGD
ncbi:MAG: SpoIIE family protein phosphatase [Desulfamplus sp.]|nr:SpoIIE family protein phosphatase [Desulfamplus sp.]